MKTLALTLLIFILSFQSSISQKDKSLIRQGVKKYESGNFEDAEIQFRKSLEENPKSSTAKFNLGSSLYRQQKVDEAAEKFQELSNSTSDKLLSSEAYYNYGNSLLTKQDYKSAIEAYKNALRKNPKDMEAKYNLEYAKQMLANQQNQDGEGDDKNENKDNNDKNDQNKDGKNDKKDGNDGQNDKADNKDGNQKDQQNQNGQDQKDQKDDNKQDQADAGNQQDDKKQQQGQQGEAKEQKISKQDAERMLQALINEEKNIQKKVRKIDPKEKGKIEKNW